MSSSYQQVEYELDHGYLWIRMNSGKYWRLRRNGKTQTWKRDIFRYRIPVKAGLKVYSEITNKNEIGTWDSNFDIICCNVDPNTCPYRASLKLVECW